MRQRARKLEIVNIYDQKQLQFIMPKTRTPFRQWDEPNCAEASLAVAFPIAPRIGVTI
jgi:hypothetical protein